MAAPPQAAAASILTKLGTPAKIGIGGAAVAIVALFYWVIFYSDISAKIQGASAQASKLSGDLATVKEEQNTYIHDKDELNAKQRRQRELNKELPAETEAASFLSSLQQAANVSGIELKTWAPLEEKSESFYAKFPMKLELSGHFHQVAKFAFEVGRVDRIINVENIELSDPKVVGDEVVLKAKCTATTFHTIKPAAAKSATPAPGAPPAASAPTGDKK